MKIEIRAAEGGDHSKTIVTKLTKTYSKYLEGKSWLHQVYHSDGFSTITCRDIPEFLNEAGGHRWQEVSPTDKRKRVHTSTVTVAVFLDNEKTERTPYDLREDHHFEMTFFSGTGCGGQHRNRHPVSVRMVHLPTGLTQKAEGRVKQNNIDDAKSRILQMLDDHKSSAAHGARNEIRSNQIGCGMRGDKRRTYRFQDDTVVDHETGRSTSCKTFMKGSIDKLW